MDRMVQCVSRKRVSECQRVTDFNRLRVRYFVCPERRAVEK